MLLLVALAAAIYYPVIGHGFVSFDDQLYILDNPAIRLGLSEAGIRTAFSTNYGGNWQPLTIVSYLVDTALFGSSAAGHHAMNLALHTVNGILLFWALRRMTGDSWPAFIVAALFLCHPAHVESVAWISGRKDVLSMLFFVLSLPAYGAWVRGPSAARYALVAALMIAGLMSKPILVTLPCVLLLFDVWPLNRIRPVPPFAGLCRALMEKLPLFAIAAGFSVLTVLTQSDAGAVSSFEALSLRYRLLNAVTSYGEYLRIFLMPADLAPIYPLPDSVPVARAAIALGLLTVISLAAFVMFGRAPFLAVGWLFFLGTLVPVIGLIQAGVQALADRYTYLSFTGLFIAAVWGIASIRGRFRISPVVAGVAAACTILALSAVARAQALLWKDDITLFEHAVAVTQRNYVAHGLLGNAYNVRGDADKALLHYNAALAIEPRYALAHAGLGVVWDGRGDLKQSVEHYNAAIALQPHHAIANSNLGALLAAQKNYELAADRFAAALEGSPDYAPALAGLGTTYLRLGRFEDAAAVFRNRLDTAPFDTDARYHLGVALTMLGRYDEAIAAFQRVLAAQPEHADAKRALDECLRLRDEAQRNVPPPR